MGVGRSDIWRARALWTGVAVVLAILALLIALVFLEGSDRSTSSAQTSASAEPAAVSDVIPAAVGYEFANPEHLRLVFTQDLTLTCEGLDAIDNGGFDRFRMDIWIDHEAGFTRIGFDYPDGSTYDLILKGWPGGWEHAWGRGIDLGRNAGCRENHVGGGYDQSIVGWAFQDSSELWFTAYLKPVSPSAEGVLVNHEGRPTQAKATGPQTYVVDFASPAGTEIRHEFTLDATEIRTVGEQRHIRVPNRFEASATIEVLKSGPAILPPDIFDTTTFTPLW